MADIIKQLMLHEGVRLKPYRCSAGKLTIGVGHNYEDTGLPDWLKHDVDIVGGGVDEWTSRLKAAFTMDMAERLLKEDIVKYEKQVRVKLPEYDNLDEIRKRVVLDMTFNMGAGWIDEFKNTVKMVREGNYEGASYGMLKSKWAKQVGKRANRLAHMMKTGLDYDAKGGFGAI